MNRARLRELGFELRARAQAGVSDQGAWFATAPDGAPVVLKWFPDETVAERYAVLPGASVRNPSLLLSPPDLRPWGASVVHTFTVGVDGWAMHEPLRTGGRRSAAVLDRVEAVGADADPAWFPTDGLVHLDLAQRTLSRGRQPRGTRS